MVKWKEKRAFENAIAATATISVAFGHKINYLLICKNLLIKINYKF